MTTRFGKVLCRVNFTSCLRVGSQDGPVLVFIWLRRVGNARLSIRNAETVSSRICEAGPKPANRIMRFLFLKAKLFGRKCVVTEPPYGTDKGCRITGYRYKDRLFITKFEYFSWQQRFKPLRWEYMKQWQPKRPPLTDVEMREVLTVWDKEPFVYKTVDEHGCIRYDCRKVSS